jgi:hypothetical protein
MRRRQDHENQLMQKAREAAYAAANAKIKGGMKRDTSSTTLRYSPSRKTSPGRTATIAMHDVS